jgi:hypothetical protein
MVSGKPRRRCFCTTEHDLRRRSNTHLSSHPAGDACAVRSETDELHSAAHCRCNWEADESIGTTAETGAFGLERVREREGETWYGRSALTQLPSGEGRTRLLSYGLHLEKRSRGMIRERILRWAVSVPHASCVRAVDVAQLYPWASHLPEVLSLHCSGSLLYATRAGVGFIPERESSTFDRRAKSVYVRLVPTDGSICSFPTAG